MFLVPLALPLLLLHGPKLGIKVLKPGHGIASKAGDAVTVNYTGKLTNGKQFDTSIGRGPFTVHVGMGEVIKGWDQGLTGVKKGEKLKLTIPPELGYGSKDLGEIPPNSTLVFIIDVLDVKH